MSCCSEVMKPIDASSCCTPHDTAAHAAQAMRDSGCGCAPLVEDTEHLKLGSVAAEDRHASEVRVETIMRPVSACCSASEPIEEARRKLREHRATSLRYRQRSRFGEVVDQRTTTSVNATSHSTL